MQTNNSSSSPITPYYQTSQNDEIDLMELFYALKKHIGLIVSITLAFACLSVVYAVTATPTYQAEAVITEPTLTKLNKLDNGINLIQLTPEKTLQRLHKALINQDLQYQFFIDNLYDAVPTNPVSPFAAYASFQKSLIVKTSNAKKGQHSFIEVNYQADNAVEAQSVLSSYLALVNQTVVQGIKDNYSATIQGKASNLEHTINRKVMAAERDIQGEIARLTEAATIARALNIQSSTSNTALTNFNLTSEITSHSLPLYTLGYKAIEIRIEALKNRKDITSFISGVPELQAELESLKTIDRTIKAVDVTTVEAFEFEKTPVTPVSPIKPKKALIAVLGTLLGGMLGVLIALVKYFTGKRQEENEEGTNADSGDAKADTSKDIAETKEAISYLNTLPNAGKKTTPAG